MAANSYENKSGRTSNVVTTEAMMGLMRRLAEVDKVELMQVAIPQTVAEAMHDLNDIGSLSWRVLDGDSGAKADLQRQLTVGADTGKYWGGLEDALGFEAVNLIRAPKNWDEIRRSGPCCGRH